MNATIVNQSSKKEKRKNNIKKKIKKKKKKYIIEKEKTKAKVCMKSFWKRKKKSIDETFLWKSL